MAFIQISHSEAASDFDGPIAHAASDREEICKGRRDSNIAPLTRFRYLRVTFMLLCGLGLWSSYCTSCSALGEEEIHHLPIVKLDPANEPIVGITTWWICGPFPISLKGDADSEEDEDHALNHDFLTDVHGSEIPVQFPPIVSNGNVEFSLDESDEPTAKPAEPRFLNQAISFPSPDVSTQLLFWGSFHVFKILYAAATIVSDREQDLILLAPSNSPIKILINGQTVLSARAGSDANAHLGTRIHLRRGENTILAKLFCFPLRNNFHVWLATAAAANAFINNQGGLIQPVEQLLVDRSSPLQLTSLATLRYSQFMSPSSSTYSVRNVSGETVRTGQVESTTSESISLNGLPDGLYSLHLANSNYQDQTYFYYGDLALFTDRFAKACTSQQPLGFPCEALRRLSSLLSDPKGRFDLPTQNAILFLIEQFQWSLSPPPLSSSDGNRILLKQYRSSLDGTNQYYYLFVPPGHENERKLRLVVVIPPASQAKPFFENDSTINPFPLQQYAAYAARYNLALIQPYARGGMVPLGKSEADVLDAISDVRHIITVDNAHIFAAGDCSGGRSAILMAEDHPDIFAAVATIDAATGFQLSSRGVLQDKVNALLRIGQLTGHPVGLIHEDPDPHSPFPQATAFLSEAAKVGVNPTIIRLPVDNTYTLKCTREEMFNYLSGLK